jgi:hypothetical protein
VRGQEPDTRRRASLKVTRQTPVVDANVKGKNLNATKQKQSKANSKKNEKNKTKQLARMVQKI